MAASSWSEASPGHVSYLVDLARAQACEMMGAHNRRLHSRRGTCSKGVRAFRVKSH